MTIASDSPKEKESRARKPFKAAKEGLSRWRVTRLDLMVYWQGRWPVRFGFEIANKF